MPESFNSPRQAIDFLTRRGKFLKLMPRAKGYWRDFFAVKSQLTDPHEIEAARYLKRHGWQAALGNQSYNP